MPEKRISFNSLIHYKKELKLHYLEISEDILTLLNGNFERGKFNQRVWVQINHHSKDKWQGGIVALGDNKGYITLSSARMKKFSVHFGDEVQVFLEKDESEFGIEVAPEFLSVLEVDEEARIRFEALSKGFQRYLLYYTLQVKSSDKRLERALMLLNNLKKSMPGQETFKELLRKD
jgi:hypothetical protein